MVASYARQGGVDRLECHTVRESGFGEQFTGAFGAILVLRQIIRVAR